ncbi:hypothetical protein GCM10009665_23210 [Kitasatospora nipponensis]|uniref:Uncharacterized protein n=1 Tax=Kitasatospora nipponensis TaxID=258049 RepID=A0ABP4GRR9_9ACTN
MLEHHIGGGQIPLRWPGQEAYALMPAHGADGWAKNQAESREAHHRMHAGVWIVMDDHGVMCSRVAPDVPRHALLSILAGMDDDGELAELVADIGEAEAEKLVHQLR